MKKLILIVIGILMLSGCNGPDGVFGLKWKSTFKQGVDKGVIYPIQNHSPFTPTLSCETIKRNIGDVKLKESSMSFYKDKFYCYYGWFTGEWNYDKLRTALLEKYGDPYTQNLKYILWNFNNVSTISLDYNPEKGEGVVCYSYLPLLKKSLKVDKTQSDL